MAERRMLTRKVTDDDHFINLSSSAQALYLHLNMSADDDGFNNQVSVCMFRAHASMQDLQSLLDNRYLLQFENGVIVIKHWRMANSLRKDRYTPTAFKDELLQLQLNKNGDYTITQPEETEQAQIAPAEEKESSRKEAYARSALPYSFDYKIRQAFYGRKCPVCGCDMAVIRDEDTGAVTRNRVPTIQHNLPISKGGEHEIGNISVICKQCNITLQDTETDKLNADEVAEEWEKISGCRLVANCLPQNRLEENRLEKNKEEKKKKGRTPKLSNLELFENLIAEGEAVKIPDKVKDWLGYKTESGFTYTKSGLRGLLRAIVRNCEQSGSSEVSTLIDECIEKGWKGIIWDRLKKPEKPKGKQHNFEERTDDLDDMALQMMRQSLVDE